MSLATIILIFFAFIAPETVEGSGLEKKLLDFLLEDYDPLVRPVLDDEDIIIVRMGLTLLDITNVDVEKNHIEIFAWAIFQWEDPFLAWNSTEYKGIKSLKLPTDRIWTPDIFPFNQIGETFKTIHNSWVIVQPNGTWTLVPPGNMMTECKMNAYMYPYDMHSCEIIFGSWAYDRNEVRGNFHGKDHQWEVLGFPAHRSVRGPLLELFVDVTCTLKFQRKGYLIYSSILFINCVIYGLIFMSNLMVPSRSFKITLSILAMLVAAYAATSFSPTAETYYPSEIAGYFSKLFFITFLVLQLNVFIYHLFYMFGSAQNFVKKILEKCPIPRPSVEMVVPPAGNEIMDTIGSCSDLQELTPQEGHNNNGLEIGDWKYLAIIIDKFFFLFCIFFAILFYLFAFPSYY